MIFSFLGQKQYYAAFYISNGRNINKNDKCVAENGKLHLQQTVNNLPEFSKIRKWR